MRRILGQLGAEGEAILIIDDARKITDSKAPGLGFGNVVEHLLLECRVIGLTVIVGAGSVASLPPSLKDQPGFARLGYTGYADQREEFGKVAGLPGQPTAGLDRDQARALVAAADADIGARALRTAAVVRLLLYNAPRVN